MEVEGHKMVHGCILHLEIIDDKIWIHGDGMEDGIAGELLAAGVPKDKIV
ncbi:element excision factor XisI family protein [Okeania sp.]|nr:element excision factor XisI family protein [Okeania sp.]MEB3343540.1 element excision factor XisI family protein [Okeania sp.]